MRSRPVDPHDRSFSFDLDVVAACDNVPGPATLISEAAMIIFAASMPAALRVILLAGSDGIVIGVGTGLRTRLFGLTKPTDVDRRRTDRDKE
jgi:hypothetical protein